jgi:membrane protein YdbS with pleckstrin-like domain
MSMSLQDNLLKDEQIVFESRKHWIAPLRDSLIPIALLIGAYLVGWFSPEQDHGIVGAFGNLLDLVRTVLIIVAVALIIYHVVLWRTAVFAVTDQRVLREEGLMSRRSSATLLSSVTDVKSRVPFIGGRLGFGDLTIYTQSGEAGADTFSSITRPIAFRDAVMEGKVRGDAGGRAKPVAAPAPQAPAPTPAVPSPATHATAAPPAADSLETIAKLAALRDSGAITPAEFDAKKAEILARV